MKKTILWVMLLCMCPSIFAQNFRVKQNSFQKVSIAFSADTLSVNSISRTEGTFSVISMNGYVPSSNPGDPQLPIFSRMLQTPVCDSIVATVKKSRYKEYDAADLGITHRLYPSQPSLPKNEEPQFVYNRSVYRTDAFYALPLVSVEKAGIKRNYALANVYVSPVQYNPVTQKIRIYTHIEVEFTFVNTDMAKTNRLQMFNSPMFSLDNNTVLNKMRSANTRVEFSGSSIKYMIVANSMFEANEDLQAFIAWKKRLGYLVEVAYVQDGASTSAIKSIVQDEYDNATSTDPAPTFLLLVGDVDQVPTFIARDDNYEAFPTDLYYATLNGSDNLPDCYYGRLSATDNTQLSNQLEKIMMYEQYTMPDPSYLGKAVLIAGIDDYFSEGHSNTHANGQINYINQNYVNANSTTHDYSTVYKHNYPYSDTYGSVAAASIISEISNGVGFANYTAHGYTDEWSLPHFGTDNIPSLANTNKYGLLIGNCCLSGKFDESECFGEALLRASKKGAMGYIGASKESIWDCDYYWAVGVRSTIQNGTSYDASNLGMYDRLFHNHGEMQSVCVSTIGGMIQAGNMAVQYSTQSYYKKYYWEIYHCFGDPSVRVFLGLPDTMTVTAANSITPGAATYTATVAPYAYVALKLDDTTFVAAAFANENGEVTLTLPSDMEEGDYELVALAQNYIPYFKDVTIEIPGCPYPKNLTVSDITPYTAHISWTDGSGTFNLEIKEGDGNWTSLVTGLNASTYQLANLPDNTDFQVRVQSVCGETTGSWKTIRFSTPEACPTPTGLAGTFNGTSANLTWTENGSATTWVLQYGSQSDFAAGSYAEVTVTDAPSATLTGLTVNNIYYARVKCDCGSLYGESPWSDIYEFTVPNRMTVCEDFEGYAATAYDVAGVVPDGWSIIFTGDSLNYAPHVAIGINHNAVIATGNGLCFTAGRDEYWTYDSYGDYCYAVLPAHEGYPQSISFKYRFFDATTGNLNVGYVTDATDANTFFPLKSVLGSADQGSEASYSLTDYNIPAGARLAFQWGQLGRLTTCGIDEVCVTYAYNHCLDMTEVTVSDVMLHSAQISLEGSASSYNLRYRLTGTSSNDTTAVIPSGSWVMVEGVSSPYTLQGLIVESTYEVMAQAVCGEDESGEWSSAVSFSTPGTCATPGNLAASNEKNTSVDLDWTGVQGSYDLRYRIAPHLGETLYFSGFETYDDLYDWATIDYDEDGYYWTYYNSSYNEVPAHNGSGSMYSISINPASGEPLHTDDWLISPQMVLGDSVSFWVRNHGMSDIADSFMVFVLFEGEEDLDVIDISPLEVATTDYVKYTVSLAPYAGEYGYIAIEHLGGAQLYLSIDDFRVFNSDTLGGDWQTVENVNSPYHLTGLTPDTKYEWYVIGKNCDGEGASTDPSQTSTFTTPEACPRPTNLVVNPVLTTAEVSWDGSSETYHLRYRVTIDGDTTSDSPWIMVDSVSSPYVINGLNTNTTYRVEVQSDCDEFLSDWNTYADFATWDPCGAPTDLDTSNVTALTVDLSWSGVQESYHVQYRVAGSDPVLYFEDFESDPIRNGDWTTIDYDGDGYDWFVSDEGGIGYSYCAASYVWESIGRRNLNPDNWLITPRIQLKDTLKVWLRGDGPYYPNDHFAIYATTGEPTVYNFLHYGTLLIPETITDHEYVQYTADLSEFQGRMGYIAIRHFNDSTMYRLDLDNFGIYGPDVTPGEWVDTIVTGNTLHLTDLSQVTDYDWRVKGICEEGETEWVYSTFSTPYYCEPLTDFSIEYKGGTDATISWTPADASARAMVNGNVNVLNWESSPHYLYFLDTNTVYTVSLQRSCGVDFYSEWTAPKSFITDCSPEDKCELTFVLKDKGDDGWDGNAIQVIDAVSGNVIATMTNEDLNGTQNWGETEVNVKTLSVCDGRELQFVWAGNFVGYTNEISYEVYDINEGLIFSGSGAGGGLPVNYTVSCEPHNCRKPTNLSAENITSYTADLNWDCPIDLEDYTVRYQTAGGINPVIYEEGFENGMGDWTTLDCYYLTHITDDTLYRVHSGQHAFSFSYNDESSTVNPQYLISSELPEIGEGTNLEFYYKSRSDIFSGYFQLGFSSTDNNTSSFVFRDTLFAHDGIWLHYNESIPAGTKYLCWKFAADNLVLAIDDIKIGTYVAVGEWDSVTTTATSTTLTGLTPNRIYNVQVKSNCTGPELWSDVTTFTTGRDPKVYQIVNNVSDATQMTWEQFAEKVYNGDFIPYDTVVLMEDISVSTMAGTIANPFISIFDGQGNTITFNYSGTVQGIAPFRYIKGATIKNLAVDGTIITSAHHAAGLVGFADNTTPDVTATLPDVVNTIENCHVSVNVSSSFSKYIGGIVGHAKCVTTNIIGCVYDGELHSGGYKGGMFGWADWATLNITNSFFKGTNAGNGTFDPVACKTHVYQNQTDETTLSVTLSNCYYNTDGDFSSTDDHGGMHNATLSGSGHHAYSVTGRNDVTVAMADDENAIYDVSGITAYDKGIVYKDTVYAGSGEKITLALGGSASGLYHADHGTLAENGEHHSLTMDSCNTVISTPAVYQIVTTVSNPATQMTWEEFASKVLDKVFIPFDTILLMEDISVDTMVASASAPFISIFNGQGHTITVDYTATAIDFTAPFRRIDGAQFRNLRVAGTINMGENKYGAGFAGDCYGDNSFTNCVSDVTIISAVNGDGTHGGFIAKNNGGTTYKTTSFTGCSFTGRLLGPNTTNCGGFCGWNENYDPHRAIVKFTNCLFIPEEVMMSTSGSSTFSRSRFPSDLIKTNIYYSQSFGTEQGKKMFSVTTDEGVTMVVLDDSTVYGLSGITAYGTGIVYDDTLYAGDEESLTLSLSGSTSGIYEADHGTLTGTENPYTLVMDASSTKISTIPCPIPSDLEIVSGSITNHSASLTWTGYTDSYNIQYRTTNGEWQTISSTGTSVELDGLAPETDYEVQVQGVCGEYGSSEWSGIKTFTTDQVYRAFQIVNTVTDNTVEMTWEQFVTRVNNGEFLATDTIALMEDISVSTMAGTYQNSFMSIFDGRGHTLTFNHTATGDYVAPFRYIDDATIKNLTVNGTVNMGEYMFGAGFAGDCYGQNHFINCVSDVTIEATKEGDGTHGGFVARNPGSTSTGVNMYRITFTACAFTGKLLGENTTQCGGFCGWSEYTPSTYTDYYAEIEFNNCVYAPQQVTMSNSNSATFSRYRNSSYVTVNNSYYTQAFGEAQGKQMYSVTGESPATVAMDGTPAESHNVSDIQAYSTGLVYRDTIIASVGEALPLILTGGSAYAADHGTLVGTANPFTITLDAYNSVISATAPAIIVKGVTRTGQTGTAGQSLQFVNRYGQLVPVPSLSRTGEILNAD